MYIYIYIYKNKHMGSGPSGPHPSSMGVSAAPYSLHLSMNAMPSAAASKVKTIPEAIRSYAAFPGLRRHIHTSVGN